MTTSALLSRPSDLDLHPTTTAAAASAPTTTPPTPPGTSSTTARDLPPHHRAALDRELAAIDTEITELDADRDIAYTMPRLTTGAWITEIHRSRRTLIRRRAALRTLLAPPTDPTAARPRP